MFKTIKKKLRITLNFKNLNIGSKYGMILMLVFILFGITTIIVTSLINNIEREVTHLEEKGNQAIEITEIGSITRAKSVSFLTFELDGMQAAIDEYEKQVEEFEQLISRFNNFKLTKKQQELLDLVIMKDKEMNELFLGELVPARISGEESASTEVTVTWVDELRKESVFLLDQLRKSMNEERAIAVENVDKHQKQTKLTLVLSMVTSILIGGLLVVFISRIISRNLNQVVEVSNKIADGDLSIEAIDYDGKDEIGRSATAINTMSKNLRLIIDQISQVSVTLDERSHELAHTADEVMKGSEQVAATTLELSSGSESQAENASELSSTMEVFSGKVQEINSNGKYIYKSSRQVLDMTESGGELMEQSVEQMAVIDQIVKDSVEKVKGLDTQSQEVSKLISVIREIADQTNLLALNAAIEAARAGEHGRGFAVVANEVKKLAEQVAISVTDITEIVERIQSESTGVAESLLVGYQEVEKGTSQIKSTGETFAEISRAMEQTVNNIQSVTDNLATMSSDSQVMSASIEEIASITEESAAGIEQTSAASQQTSSSMEEVTSSAEELSELSDKMNDLVRQFNL